MTNSMLTLKENGQVTQLAQEGVLPERIILEGPSVVTLPVGPEAVLRYDRVGLDLVLVLADGSRITIVNFFVTGPDDARNDIVFVDGNEVMWWGQYTQPWQGFQIAEIEPGAVPGAFGFFGPGLLAGLAGGGALIAGGGGDDGGNNPPVATDDAGSVREAGVQAGGNAGDPGVAQASGNVLTNDSDIDGGTLVVTGVALAGGGSAAPGDVLVGVHGDLTLGSDGVWTYVLDNGRGATEGLALGQTAQEVFTYTVSDGQGGTAVADLVVTVTGTNDLPVIDAAA
ncbi:BapA/Bap/LapF family prefix-like domain-containing protein, partial [Szabonella alba]